MKKFLFDCGTRDATASLGLFALRVLIGSMMLIGHGIPKIQNFATLKPMFPVPPLLDGLLSPPASLILCICAEAGAAAFVILGIATRPAAFLLGLCMVFAGFGYLNSAPWFQSTPTLVETKELSVLYLIPMLAIILAGAGSYSFDALLHKEDKRRRW